MKSFAVVAAGAALFEIASAHYFFSSIIDPQTGTKVDNQVYIRKNSNGYQPFYDINSTDFRCNMGSMASAKTTKTYEIAAGKQIGMGLDYGAKVEHPGPLSVMLSKVPDGMDITDYDGSGKWFKIYELAAKGFNSSGIEWGWYGVNEAIWTIPEDTPPGYYLMRAEHDAVHEAFNAPTTMDGTQYYFECAHIQVTGGNPDAQPGPLVDIPGYITGWEPGLFFSMYYPTPKDYTVPGPAVWPGNDPTTGWTEKNGQRVDAAPQSSGAVSMPQAAASVQPASASSSSVAAAASPVSSASQRSSSSVSSPTTMATSVKSATTQAAVAVTSKAADIGSSSSSTAAPAAAPSASTHDGCSVQYVTVYSD